MSLVGKYRDHEIGGTLIITSANDSNGIGAGTFSFAGNDYEIALHYHFQDDIGPNTVLQIWCTDVHGWNYLGAAGWTASKNGATGIHLSGGFSFIDATKTFRLFLEK